jgi:hypothetical protein
MEAAELRENLVFLLAGGAALILVFLFVAYSTVGT